MVSNFNTRDRLLSATHSSSGHENDADAVVAAAEVDESAKGIASSGKLSVGNNLFGPIFVSLCIFLLPFFALSPEPALAVQSGGRMGGSFGGASSSRSYAGSRSYSQVTQPVTQLVTELWWRRWPAATHLSNSSVYAIR